jgi:hypothetical protein
MSDQKTGGMIISREGFFYWDEFEKENQILLS